MAKTYLNTVKYETTIEFEIDGVVDKHDIIGAVFGQSEGLLGEDLDLRELQKNGKIGRIEIELTSVSGKTKGTLMLPSSLDMVETSILAAAIETVDKVGPCNAVFKTKSLIDTRTKKRMQVIERAKALLQKLMAEQIPETAELTKEVREKVRTAEIQEFGKERLPAGPNIKDSESIIIVEGRADVLNLLKHNIKNVIAMGGSNIPQTIIDLCREKTVTVFVDGDRGGNLNLKKLMQLAEVDFIARAPPGKEVEELTGKEIIMALRRKSPAIETEKEELEQPRFGMPFFKQTQKFFEQKTFNEKAFEEKPFETHEKLKEPNPFEEQLKKIQGTMKALLLDKEGNEKATVDVRDLLKAIKTEKDVHAIVFDGIITKRLVDEAEQAGIHVIAGIKEAKFIKPQKLKTYVL